MGCGAFAIVVMLACAGAVAEAQQPKKVPRIGYLTPAEPARESTRAEAIRLALRELGYIEGQNIAIEYRYAEGKWDRLPELAAELVRLNVDIIVAAGGSIPVRAAKNATKTIPIVMWGAGTDPVEEGLVESLARPGGNVTGLTNLGPELGGKRLELLKEAVPKVARVAVLYDPAIPASVRELKEVLPAAARALGLTVQSWEVRAADGFEKVFAALNKERPDGLYVLGGPLMGTNQKRIVGLCVKEPVTVDVLPQRSCRCRRAHVLRGGHRGQLQAGRILRGQNPEGSQACRSACRAADEVRVCDKSENGQADRPDDSAGGARPGE